jgi:isopenicillin-N epimerase
VSAWSIRGDTIYLNHGSFGPPPNVVRAARRSWIDRLEAQPMDVFVRTLEPALFEAREKLARFVDTAAENLVFAENATSAMNAVAWNVELARGDEVLLTSHEYGAVRRIWERACTQTGAEIKIIELPLPLESKESIVEAVFARASERTRLIVVSHVTSATATIFPVAEICRAARAREIAVCIDGPHAIAQIPLSIDALDCDYYTASCHKWLCAPFGSGFLYVHPRRQEGFQPPQLSWGRIRPEDVRRWDDEFLWSGTRDPSAYLSVPAAIEFMESAGLEAFRRQTHALAQDARQRIEALTGQAAPVPDSDAPDSEAPDSEAPDSEAPDSEAWYGSMSLSALPAGDRAELQDALWNRFGIEVPIIDFQGGRYIRVSCHLYNDRSDIDRLLTALGELL